MTLSTMEKINILGQLLRFITPTLLCVIGYLLNFGILDIKTSIKDLDLHFTNHLAHHQELEIGYERRLSRLDVEQENLKEKIVELYSIEKKIRK